MLKLLLATTNPGKIREYRFLLRNLDYNIVTLKELGINQPPVETRNSYEENARIKAITYAKLSQLVTLADDSGLEVDALNGEPGVRSARFAGEAASDAEKIKFLLTKLADVPWGKRTAHFKCVIVIATPEGELEICHGECHGIIAFEPKGKNGFGYDPVFYLPEINKTIAELPLEVKNQVSHRSRAAGKARKILQEFHSQHIDFLDNHI